MFGTATPSGTALYQRRGREPPTEPRRQTRSETADPRSTGLATDWTMPSEYGA